MKKLWLQHRRLILSLTGALIIILLALAAHYHFVQWLAQTAWHSPQNIVVTPANTLDKPVSVTFTGTVEGHKASALAATSFGRVTELYVKEGDSVKAGQPLMTIESIGRPSAPINPPAGSNAAPAAVNAPSGPVDTVGVQQAQSSYDTLQKKYARLQKLYDQGAVSKKELNQAASRLQEAQDALAAAETPAPEPPATPLSADNQFTADTGAMPAPQAGVSGGPIKIIAPADGIVSGLTAISGGAVQAGQQLLALSNGAGIQTVVQLSQSDLYFVRSGSKAEILSDLLPDQVLPGQVESIFPANNQLFRTQVRIDQNPNNVLQPGMSVTVRFQTAQTVPALVVPTNAIVEDEQGNTCVFVSVNGHAVRQQVVLGDAIGEFREVSSGLPEQALVASGDVAGLKDGDALPSPQS